MELLLLSSLIVILAASIAYLLFPPHLHRRPKQLASNLPGNMGLPFIGESHKFAFLIAKGKFENFVLDSVSKYSSPIFQTSLFGDRVIVMHGQETNKFLFTKGSSFMRLWFPRPVRKIFPAFNGDVIKPINIQDVYRPVLQSQTALQHHVKFIDRMVQMHLENDWVGKHQVCIYPQAKRFALSIACNIMLSVRDEELISKLLVNLDAIERGLTSIPLNLPFTSFRGAIKASKALLNQLRLVVHERILKGNTPNELSDDVDLLSHLLHGVDKNGKKMTETEVAEVVLVSIAASYTTTASLISVICCSLADHPDIYRRVYEEQKDVSSIKTPGEMLELNDIYKMKYTWNVAREAMRIHSPYPFFYREVLSDFTISDFHISKGSKIMVYIPAIHKDPQYFTEPEKFDPSRFEGKGPSPYTYIAFGGGSMECPARKYAQLLVLVYIHNIINKFRWEKVCPDEKFVFTTVPEPTQGLPVFLYPL